jgi:hypothetical protein
MRSSSNTITKEKVLKNIAHNGKNYIVTKSEESVFAAKYKINLLK